MYVLSQHAPGYNARCGHSRVPLVKSIIALAGSALQPRRRTADGICKLLQIKLGRSTRRSTASFALTYHGLQPCSNHSSLHLYRPCLCISLDCATSLIRQYSSLQSSFRTTSPDSLSRDSLTGTDSLTPEQPHPRSSDRFSCVVSPSTCQIPRYLLMAFFPALPMQRQTVVFPHCRAFRI